AGYIGAMVCEELLAAGREVVVLDALEHGQSDVVERLVQRGAQVVVGDIRDGAARDRALAGARAVVHLAAIVGDPACARSPELSWEVNVEASRAVIESARAAGAQRLVFASTCSNYGRMADSTVAIDEQGELAPLSLYAEQKVEIEQALLRGDFAALKVCCLRFATVYGVAPRMRFDLTVNEFTRDLHLGHELAVFGQQFWRPYIHVRDAGRAVCSVLEAPEERVAGRVYNAGSSDENYRKSDLIEAIRSQTSNGSVSFVDRPEDPRDYKVSFGLIGRELGFETTMTVPEGIAEIIDGLEAQRFGDPFDPRYRN
ncbi:MAG TPA: NAD(P)-dependent oxidoreductase, partial [Solirubrobacteraceae bacterium]|nr:NAD(P)-dependent oxidoreductase [Solirubrobacteraceae bacterium]